MNLSLKKIRKYGFEERLYKPDWDDVAIEFTLPNGLLLTGMTVCSLNPTDCDMLEGLDGWICINTVEELEKLMELSYNDIIKKISSENEDFNMSNYLEEE